MAETWVENWYQAGYAVHIRKKKYKNGKFCYSFWRRIGWIKKMKDGSWNAYHLNKHARCGKLMKAGFKRRKDAVAYIIRRKK